MVVIIQVFFNDWKENIIILQVIALKCPRLKIGFLLETSLYKQGFFRYAMFLHG